MSRAPSLMSARSAQAFIDYTIAQKRSVPMRVVLRDSGWMDDVDAIRRAAKYIGEHGGYVDLDGMPEEQRFQALKAWTDGKVIHVQLRIIRFRRNLKIINCLIVASLASAILLVCYTVSCLEIM